MIVICICFISILTSGTFDDITDDRELSNLERKDELADILSPHFNLEFKMDGNDVEEIFKGVLTDESQVTIELT